MLEQLLTSLHSYKEKTGTTGLALGILVVLFILSLLSDVMYGTTTVVSSLVKIVLIGDIGYTSFVFFSGLSTNVRKTKKRIATKNNIHKKKKLINTIQKTTIIKPINPLQEVETLESAHVDESTENKEATPVLSALEKEELIKQEEQQEQEVSCFRELREDLKQEENTDRALKQRDFFNNAETRKYLGVNISKIVQFSETYASKITLNEIQELLQSEIHDERIMAVWLLISTYKESQQDKQEEIYNFYIENRGLVDNWDMVDLAARNILGIHICNHPEKQVIAKELLRTDSVWDKRTIAMSAHPLVLSGNLGYGFSVCEQLINHDEELVQSAIGWVLKEAYKQDSVATELFIRSHFESLSKQAIRIGTERMEKDYRKSFLKGEFAMTAR